MSNENSTILNNTIYNNIYGIRILSSANNTLVMENDLVNLEKQASDDGSNNTFRYNFWADLTSPDANQDGIVDIPYSIEGDAKNQDLYPKAAPYSSISFHYLSNPVVLYPNGGETLNSSVTIQWAASNDILGHIVTYSVYFYPYGDAWKLIVSGLTNTSIIWDISKVDNGTTYLVKVVAKCSEGLIIEDISDNMFTIQNTLYSPSVTSTPFSGFYEIFLILGILVIVLRKNKSNLRNKYKD